MKGSSARARLAATGALAVDMETAALVGVPWQRPVTVVRAVSDTLDRELLSPAIIRGGWRALRPLRAAAPVARRLGRRRRPEDRPAGRPAVVLRRRRAGHRDRRAGAGPRTARPVYVRRQIVHNRHVVADLERRGAVFVHELDEVPDGATVVFSAHGVAPRCGPRPTGGACEVVDATCPLVAKVHHEVRRFQSRGYQVVLIGHAGHDETEGTLGEGEGVTLVEDRGRRRRPRGRRSRPAGLRHPDHPVPR